MNVYHQEYRRISTVVYATEADSLEEAKQLFDDGIVYSVFTEEVLSEEPITDVYEAPEEPA